MKSEQRPQKQRSKSLPRILWTLYSTVLILVLLIGGLWYMPTSLFGFLSDRPASEIVLTTGIRIGEVEVFADEGRLYVAEGTEVYPIYKVAGVKDFEFSIVEFRLNETKVVQNEPFMISSSKKNLLRLTAEGHSKKHDTSFGAGLSIFTYKVSENENRAWYVKEPLANSDASITIHLPTR